MNKKELSKELFSFFQKGYNAMFGDNEFARDPGTGQVLMIIKSPDQLQLMEQLAQGTFEMMPEDMKAMFMAFATQLESKTNNDTPPVADVGELIHPEYHFTKAKVLEMWVMRDRFFGAKNLRSNLATLEEGEVLVFKEKKEDKDPKFIFMKAHQSEEQTIGIFAVPSEYQGEEHEGSDIFVDGNLYAKVDCQVVPWEMEMIEALREKIIE